MGGDQNEGTVGDPGYDPPPPPVSEPGQGGQPQGDPAPEVIADQPVASAGDPGEGAPPLEEPPPTPPGQHPGLINEVGDAIKAWVRAEIEHFAQGHSEETRKELNP